MGPQFEDKQNSSIQDEEQKKQEMAQPYADPPEMESIQEENELPEVEVSPDGNTKNRSDLPQISKQQAIELSQARSSQDGTVLINSMVESQPSP